MFLVAWAPRQGEYQIYYHNQVHGDRAQPQALALHPEEKLLISVVRRRSEEKSPELELRKLISGVKVINPTANYHVIQMLEKISML